MVKDFPEILQSTRQRLGLTNVALADRAKVPASLISEVQNGKRAIGELQATKIGRALNLEDDALRRFILRAVSDSTRKVLTASANYPAEVINAAPSALKLAKISPDQLKAVEETQEGVSLVLVNGKHAILQTTVQEVSA